MQRIVTSLLSDMKRAPGLMDIRASSAPPRIWNSIASHSVYAGFDPALDAARSIDARLDEAFIKRAGYWRRRARRAMESIRRTLSRVVRRIAIR
jgi:hypothetical protein